MNEEYDFIVLGTGLKECILSGLMSVNKNTVLHMDQNNYYGAETTSMTPLRSLFNKFEAVHEEKYGKDREWNVDLIPKFIMANGILKFTEKIRLKGFLDWIVKFDPDSDSKDSVYNPKSSVYKLPIENAFIHFNIQEPTRTLIGHAICLYTDDKYIKDIPAIEVIRKAQLYYSSVNRFGKSPYIYPLYGLGELPQAFARLSAVHGGTYMLDKPVDEIIIDNGKVVGVKSNGEVAYCKKLICDPSYVPHLVKKVGQVARAICLLNHPIANVQNISSLQIILPGNQLGRQNEHEVCPANYYVVIVATKAETSNPKEELQPGIKLLGPMLQIFYNVSDIYEPIDDGSESNIFISKSYDASTHFESTCADVLEMYKRITGEPFDFTKVTKTLSD